jgi:hypothetical protein
MGTYLATGILQKICFRKGDIPEKITIDHIAIALRKDINLDHYLYQEDENGIYWTIKPSLLEGNFPEFLEKQFNLYQLESKDFTEIFAELKQNPSGEERINLLDNKTFPHLQKIKHIFEIIAVKGDDIWKKNIRVNYHLIAFLMDGKIIMECYGQILRYLEQNVRLNNQQFPVAQCLKILITG